ncbi:MAG: flagellar motor switch protein FliN [Planctomycetota bacterium]|nr:MAG: flagellar motor switch protein FliN [Planctomycetota bacterium]
MADDSEQIGQDEIEKLLAQAQAGNAPSVAPAKKPEAGPSLGQDEIEALLKGGGIAPSPASPTSNQVAGAGSAASATKAAPLPNTTTPKPSATQAASDVELLLNHAQAAIASVQAEHDTLPPGAKPLQLQDFAGSPPSTEAATFDLIRDVELDLEIELGRTHMYLEDVLKLRKGAVVSLDKLAGDPVDIYVNGRLIARGEVLVLNDNFCVRVAELVVGERVDAA